MSMYTYMFCLTLKEMSIVWLFISSYVIWPIFYPLMLNMHVYIYIYKCARVMDNNYFIKYSTSNMFSLNIFCLYVAFQLKYDFTL